MFEFKKPTGAGKYKGCDSCGKHDGVPVPLPIRWKMWMFASQKWSKYLLNE